MNCSAGGSGNENLILKIIILFCITVFYANIIWLNITIKLCLQLKL